MGLTVVIPSAGRADRVRAVKAIRADVLCVPESEAAAYAFLRRIDYIVEECPFAKGATSIAHKEILNRMEEASPGAKHNFLFGFLEKARPAFERAEAVQLNECARCGQVTTGTVCAFCKLADQVKRAAADVPPAPEQ